MEKSLLLLVVFALLQYTSGQTILNLRAGEDPPEIEEGSFGTPIIISLASGSTRPTTISIVISFAVSGTATAGVDYVAPSDFTYTTFGNDEQMFNLEIIEDSIAELTETITLTASVVSGPAEFDTNMTTLTLDDDDVPFFQLSTANVVESVGSAVVVVELSGTEIAFDVEVTVVTTDPASSPSPATAGVDYDVTSSVLTFTSGSMEGDTQTVPIPITNDNLVERTEVFDVQLLVPRTTPPADIDTIAIFDDDELTVAFEQSEYSVDEDAGSQEVCVVITANMLADDRSAQVSVTSAELDAQEGDPSPVPPADYGMILQDLTFPASSGVGDSQCFNVPIVDEDLVEDTESFRLDLVLIAGQPVVLGTPDSTIVSIFDEDQITVAFEQSEYSVDEDAGSREVCVVITANMLADDRSAQVRVTSAELDAQEGDPSPVSPADYGMILQDLTFPASSGVGDSQCVFVPIVDDTVFEDTESFRLDLVLIAGEPVILGTPDNTIVSIFDNDPITLALSQPSHDVNENVGSFVVTVELQGSASLDEAIEVMLASTGGTATGGGVDYDTVGVTLTFSSGSLPGATVQTSVFINDDNRVEFDETFFIDALTSNPRVNFVPGTDRAEVTIRDNDFGDFEFSELTYSAQEDDGVLTANIRLSSGILDRALTVNVESSDLTALAGLDYTAFSSDFTFPSGSTPGVTMDIDITILPDDVVEDTESFRLSLSPVTSGSRIIIGRGVATAFITDEDSARFGFDPVEYSVSEGAGNVDLTVWVRFFNGSGLERDLIVVVESVDGTATAGDDYIGVSTELTFPSGTSQDDLMHFVVTILSPDCVEEREFFNLQLSAGPSGSPDPAIIIIPDRQEATVNIDDSSSVTIGFEPDAYSVVENEEEVMVCVELSQGCLDRSVEFNLFTNQGSGEAEDGSDYTGVSMDLSYDETNMGDTMCVLIPIINDTKVENEESFYAQLQLTPSGDPIVFNPDMSRITIIDDDSVVIQPEFPEYRVDEGPPVQCVDVVIESIGVKEPGIMCNVTVHTVDGTAIAGEDYDPFWQNLTFSSEVTNHTITICIVDNLDDEPEEDFYVTVASNNPDCRPGRRARVVIIDDEDCDDMPCHPRARCDELVGADNFTCTCISPFRGDGFMCERPPVVFGDDPHFSITLPGGKLLCYTVQGEHGFTFNLISNEKVFMNALFVPDSRRDEVTWLGSVGIVVKSSYRKSNFTALRFEALEKKIYINDKVVLEPRNVEKLTFSNGKLSISEAPPMEGFKYPKVHVDLQDVGLSFSIQFLAEHFDLFWHSTGQQTENSHGIIGQFFRKGVEIDEVRKILIMPNKEPVPVMRRPVWSFMEREKVTSDDQLCWTAMNPGYQGEGLIDGTYFDYLVNDVLSTDIEMKKY